MANNATTPLAKSSMFAKKMQTPFYHRLTCMITSISQQQQNQQKPRKKNVNGLGSNIFRHKTSVNPSNFGCLNSIRVPHSYHSIGNKKKEADPEPSSSGRNGHKINLLRYNYKLHLQYGSSAGWTFLRSRNAGQNGVEWRRNGVQFSQPQHT